MVFLVFCRETPAQQKGSCSVASGRDHQTSELETRPNRLSVRKRISLAQPLLDPMFLGRQKSSGSGAEARGACFSPTPKTPPASDGKSAGTPIASFSSDGKTIFCGKNQENFDLSRFRCLTEKRARDELPRTNSPSFCPAVSRKNTRNLSQPRIERVFISREAGNRRLWSVRENGSSETHILEGGFSSFLIWVA
jgi:hypothetical protein